MIEITEPGIQTTIQAGPRIGYRHLGIPLSGAADPLSLALANRLCGNGWDRPALEITLGPFACRTLRACTLAITGGPAETSLNGKPVPRHTALRVESGSELRIGPLKSGCRAYLAVSGGLKSDIVLGSASTYLPARFGGHGGRALLSGDRLGIEAPADGKRPRSATATPEDLRPSFGSSHILRITAGLEWNSLTTAARRAFFAHAFEASHQSSRMGVRLEGNELALQEGRKQIISSAVAPGTVQCPASGNPIVLGSDAQVTGGYPRLASVIAADLWLLGQIRPGNRVRFVEVSLAEANQALLAIQARMKNWCGDHWLTTRGRPLEA